MAAAWTGCLQNRAIDGLVFDAEHGSELWNPRLPRFRESGPESVAGTRTAHSADVHFRRQLFLA